MQSCVKCGNFGFFIDEICLLRYNISITSEIFTKHRKVRKIMTYHELVKKVQDTLTAVDASAVSEHIAVQVNVTGEAEGIFYIEAAEGKLNVEPYDYVDRDALVAASEESLLAVMAGKLNVEQAIADGTIYFEGNFDKMAMLSAVFAQLPVKKTKKAASKKTAAEKKPAAKKPAAKKTTKKAAAKAEAVETVAAPVETPAAEAPAPAKRKCTRTKKAETAAEAKPAAKKTRKTKKTEETTEA